MAALETWQLIAIICLSLVAVFLAVLMLSVMVLYLKKRRLLCFSDDAHRKKRDEEKLLSKYTSENVSKKKIGRRRIGQTDIKRFSDPFAGKFSDPIHMEDFYDDNQDWDNPLFDVQAAKRKDAAITIQTWWRMARVRFLFLETKEASLLIQCWWRGIQVRSKLPQYRKEKQEREQKRKKEPGYLKKKGGGTLAELKFYDVKGFGFAEVEQLYGIETMRNAADQLMSLYGGKGKKKLKIFISVKGVALYEQSLQHFATVKMSTISFCSLDPKNKKLFGFINKKRKRNFCHVFQCHERDAQRMVETMAEAFEVTFRITEQTKWKEQEELLAKQRKEKLKQSTQELNKEIDNMLHFAETASLGTPTLSVKGSDRISMGGACTPKAMSRPSPLVV